MTRTCVGVGTARLLDDHVEGASTNSLQRELQILSAETHIELELVLAESPHSVAGLDLVALDGHCELSRHLVATRPARFLREVGPHALNLLDLFCFCDDNAH